MAVDVSVISIVSGGTVVGKISAVVGAGTVGVGTVGVGTRVTCSEEFGGELVTAVRVAFSGGGGISSAGIVVGNSRIGIGSRVCVSLWVVSTATGVIVIPATDAWQPDNMTNEIAPKRTIFPAWVNFKNMSPVYVLLF